jgi:hypothetical protein
MPVVVAVAGAALESVVVGGVFVSGMFVSDVLVIDVSVVPVSPPPRLQPARAKGRPNIKAATAKELEDGSFIDLIYFEWGLSADMPPESTTNKSVLTR